MKIRKFGEDVHNHRFVAEDVQNHVIMRKIDLYAAVVAQELLRRLCHDDRVRGGG